MHRLESEQNNKESSVADPPIPQFIFAVTTMSAATGRRQGVVNYSQEEIKSVLDIMEDILPIGPDEWEEVVKRHTR